MEFTETQMTLINLINDGKLSVEYDNYGQIVIYTGIWEDEDGKLHNTPVVEEEE